MKIFLFLSILFTTTYLQAQNFEELIQEGNELYDEEKYLASGKAYNKAFLLKEGTADQYYNAACSWALSGDTTQSLKYLDLSADKGWKNLKHMKRDKDLRSLHIVTEWDEIVEKVQMNVDEYEKDFDKPLKTKLEQVYIRDQTLRQLYRDAEEKFGKTSEEMDYFWKLINIQDSLNRIEVEKIIEENGWVPTSRVGKQANMSLWLVVQHAPLETQKKYLPLLQESVKKGESNGKHLALLEDRILVRSNKPQKYGSQFRRDSKTGISSFFEIENPAYVNQRRKAIGLGPIEAYAKKNNIEWSIPQKEK